MYMILETNTIKQKFTLRFDMVRSSSWDIPCIRKRYIFRIVKEEVDEWLKRNPRSIISDLESYGVVNILTTVNRKHSAWVTISLDLEPHFQASLVLN